MNATRDLRITLATAVIVLWMSGTTIAVERYVPSQYPTIQAAIDASANGDMVIIEPGNYTGAGNRDIDFKGKAITVRSIDPNDPNIVAATVIDCQGTEAEPHRGFYFHNGEGNDSVLSGLTITGGYGPLELIGFYTHSCGGAIYCKSSSPTVTNCTFSGNSARYGGGMDNSQSSPRVTNCTFSGNSAGDGGGMSNYWYSPRVANCTFSANSAERYGGGMHIESSSPTITNCTFAGNTANSAGGGMTNYQVINPTISNCTFVYNSAPDGPAMGCDSTEQSYPGTVTIANSIVWNGPAWLWNNDGSTITITYSDVEGGWLGEGNIDDDPCFVERGYWDPNGTPGDANDDFWVAGDYHLLGDSPCINEGDPEYIAEPDDVDMDGELRVMLGRVDMGADEFNPFSAEFVVVRKQRVDRTVFEYECQLVLENISRFAISGISLEMAKWSENMTIIESSVTFGDAEIGPGESITSVDTCTFRVDRSEAIDQAEIIWHVTAELVAGGAKTEYTVSITLPPDPQTGFNGLKDLAEKWLWQGTAGGIDADSVADGTVNLADFAKFAEAWIKQ